MVFYNLRELASQLVHLIGRPSQVCIQHLVLQTCKFIWSGIYGVLHRVYKLLLLFFLICSQVIKDLQVKTQYHRLIANSFVVVSITYSIFNCILCVVRCLSVLIIIGPSRLSITSWHMKNPDLLLSQGNTSLACNKPRVNSIKELQVYSTSRTLVFTNSHTYELNKSISKFPLQASNLYLQWYFVELNFFKLRFTCAIYNNYCKKSTIIVSLLSWPQICFGPSLCSGLSYFAE